MDRKSRNKRTPKIPMPSKPMYNLPTPNNTSQKERSKLVKPLKTRRWKTISSTSLGYSNSNIGRLSSYNASIRIMNNSNSCSSMSWPNVSTTGCFKSRCFLIGIVIWCQTPSNSNRSKKHWWINSNSHNKFSSQCSYSRMRWWMDREV
jgi:hypothetical protein